MLAFQQWNCDNENELKKRSNDRLHVTSLRVELSEQVTKPTILICNINNETIKMCSSGKQFFYSTVYTD